MFLSALQSSVAMGTCLTLRKKKKKRKLGKIVLEAHYSTVDCNMLNAVTVYSFYAIDWRTAGLSQWAGVHQKFAAA